MYGQRSQEEEGVLRTIRLSKKRDELLQKDTDLKRISVGVLLSAILTGYS
jgi:hypothetical protein